MPSQAQREASVDAVSAPPRPAPAPAPAPTSRPGPPRKPSLWRALSSGLVDGGIAAGLGREEARVAALDAQDLAREEAIAEAARRRAIVQQAFPDDPMAQIAAESNWEEFGKQLSENFGVDIAAGGSTIMARGRQSVAPKVDQFDDRAGVTTVTADGPVTQYTDPRAPTFEELSQDAERQRVTVPQGSQVFDLGAANSTPAGGDLWSRLIQQESGGDQSAVSPKGAFGRAQLMPDTAAYVARRLGDPSLAERARTDPAINEQLGQAYLQEQQQRFGNDAVALAAYNAGPEKAAEWVRRFGMPQPGQEAAWAAQIPFAETRQYVRNILRLGDAPAQAPASARPSPPPARLVADNPRPPVEQTPLTPAQRFSQEQQLRAQFGSQPAVRDLASVRSQIGIIGSIAQKAAASARGEGPPVSAQDDLALIFSFMKMLDPGSVVREGEFANAQNTAGIPDRIRNAYNNALSGTRLSDSQRTEFFNTATSVMDSYSTSYADQADRYRGLAPRYGLDPDAVAPQASRPRQRRPAPPARPAQRPAAPAARPAAPAPRAKPISEMTDAELRALAGSR